MSAHRLLHAATLSEGGTARDSGDHWGQLRDWLVDDRDFRAWQERLRGSLARWRVMDREQGGLLRGVALAEAQAQLKQRPEELAAAEREFIEASAVADDEGCRRERRRRRLPLGGLNGGLALREDHGCGRCVSFVSICPTSTEWLSAK